MRTSLESLSWIRQCRTVADPGARKLSPASPVQVIKGVHRWQSCFFASSSPILWSATEHEKDITDARLIVQSYSFEVNKTLNVPNKDLMLWKFHNCGSWAWSLLPVCNCLHLKFLNPCHPRVQKVQNSFAYGRDWVLPPPHGIPTTKPAFIEWQSTICRSLLSPKILGPKAKNHQLNSTFFHNCGCRTKVKGNDDVAESNASSDLERRTSVKGDNAYDFVTE